jgi:hypothetical protein
MRPDRGRLDDADHDAEARRHWGSGGVTRHHLLGGIPRDRSRRLGQEQGAEAVARLIAAQMASATR